MIRRAKCQQGVSFSKLETDSLEASKSQVYEGCVGLELELSGVVRPESRSNKENETAKQREGFQSGRL